MKMNQHLIKIAYQFTNELSKPREQFLEYWQTKRQVSIGRIDKELRCNINQFTQFMVDKGINDLKQVNQALVIQFQYHLYSQFISTWMVYRKIKDIGLYFGYLYHQGIIYANPFINLKIINPPDINNVDRIKRRYSFRELTLKWINYMKQHNLNYLSIEPKIISLKVFVEFLKSRGIKSIYKITKETIGQYRQYLTTYEYEPNKTYQPFTQINRLRHACQFLLYLKRYKLIIQNPTENIILRKELKELNEKVWNKVLGEKASPITGITTPWDELVDKFINYQLSRGGSPRSTKNYIVAVKLFYKYCSERNKLDLKNITKRDIIDYNSWLYSIKNTKNQKYSPNSIFNHAANLRSFFKFLVKYDYLICDPTSTIDLPKHEDGMPHSCMDQREVNIILAQPDVRTPVGIRDKAIMEILYSTGIRISELAGLKENDIDFTNGYLKVNYPKGGRSYERIVPIGRIALEYSQKYIKEVRPGLDPQKDKTALFLSLTGKPLTKHLMNACIKRYLFKSGLRKHISAHSFRVSCATHMLNNNADIRYVQEQLGHRSIRTTQRYTRLVPKNLKAVHARCHPRERIKISG